MRLRFILFLPLLILVAGCASDDAPDGNVPAVDAGAGVVTATYRGRTLFRGTKAPVPDITVQVAGANDDGSPTDDVFGTAQTDTGGHFTVTSTAPAGRPVVLVAAAVAESAETGGDRRGEGYEIKKHETVLGTLSNPSPTAANTLLVNPKQPGRPDE